MKKSSSLKFIMVFIMMFKALLMPKASYASDVKQCHPSPLTISEFKAMIGQKAPWAGWTVSYDRYIDINIEKCHWFANNVQMPYEDSVFFQNVTPWQVIELLSNLQEEYPANGSVLNSGFNIRSHGVEYKNLSLDGTIAIGTHVRSGIHFAFIKVICGNFVLGTWGQPEIKTPDPLIVEKIVEVPGETVYQTDTVHDSVPVYVDRWHYYPETREVFREGYVGGASVMFAWGVSYDRGYSYMPYQQPHVVQNYYTDNSINNSFNTTTTTITHPVIHHNPIPTPVITNGGPSEANGGNPDVNPGNNGGADEAGGGKFVGKRNAISSNHRNVVNNYKSNTSSRPTRSEYNPTSRPVKNNSYDSRPTVKNNYSRPRPSHNYSSPRPASRPQIQANASRGSMGNRRMR
jgi:hypothetical protein